MAEEAGQANVRRVRLFRNGRSQAVRIPKEFEFEGEEVEMIRSEDGSVRLRTPPRKAKTAAEFIAWLREQPPMEDFPGDPGDDDLLPLDEPQFD